MIELKLSIALLCGVLDALGGFCFLPARRFIMPTVLCVTTSILLHIWWIGFLILPVIGTLVLGYKDFGSGNFSRGMWLFVQYFLVGIGLCLTRHLAWYFFAPYCVLGGILGGSLVRVWQPLGDLIEGSFLGTILFLIH
jgi:hypothetical protein